MLFGILYFKTVARVTFQAFTFMIVMRNDELMLSGGVEGVIDSRIESTAVTGYKSAAVLKYRKHREQTVNDVD